MPADSQPVQMSNQFFSYKKGANSTTPFAKLLQERMKSEIEANKGFDVTEMLLKVTRERNFAMSYTERAFTCFLVEGQREEHGSMITAPFII